MKAVARPRVQFTLAELRGVFRAAGFIFPPDVQFNVTCGIDNVDITSANPLLVSWTQEIEIGGPPTPVK